MKRRVRSFAMALLMLLVTALTSFTDVMIVRADELTIRLHYHREDGAYGDWDVWMWEVGGEGAAFELVQGDNEAVATKTVTPGVTSVGYIVRKPDWSAKDVDADQFIDLSSVVSGTVDVYVESGVQGCTTEFKDAVQGVKLASAKYDGDLKIEVAMTDKITGKLDSVFTVKGSAGEAKIASVTEGENNVYTVTLAEGLDLTKAYTVAFDGNDYKVSMPSIYSTESFEKDYTYTGNDLGATWTKESTKFRVWAPTAESVSVQLYKSGTKGTDDLIESVPMQEDVNGTWVAEKSGDLNGTYYTYLVNVNGAENEACDPYARTTGVNGDRAMVIDLDSTDPEGWENDVDPHYNMKITDAILYELHVRDLSMDDNSGIQNKGKFLGLIETGTKNSKGVATGLDHLKELGFTHLHILPAYDYGSVDESKLDTPQFNWGYDPKNYNVPEGSYSTDPYNGEVRVKEMKQMVKGLHDNEISVVMDVVYNHVQSAGEFSFNLIVPEYFSRVDENGKYSNGSGCGNDTASERAMVKKYIVDSVAYWADEYHIDGFRFDLVGLLDTETINAIIEEVHKTHPNVIFYGEGWTMSTTLTKDDPSILMCTQANSTAVSGFSFFSDTIRDHLKGSVFSETEPGFVTGAEGGEEKLRKCWMGFSPIWCTTPSQSINYVSCHDNNTLWDRITMTVPDEDEATRVKRNNLAAAIYITAEGTPFMQAGEEMLRSKPNGDGTYNSNSYASSDEINSLKWEDLNNETNMNVFNYYKGLIAFRKNHAALRLSTAEEVNGNVTAVEGLDANVVAFDLKGGVNGEVADEIYVIFNANKEEKSVSLPEGDWQVCVNAEKAGTDVIETVSGNAKVTGLSAMILVKGKTVDENAYKAYKKTSSTSTDKKTTTTKEKKNNGATMFIVVMIVVIVLAIAFGIYSSKKRKKNVE